MAPFDLRHIQRAVSMILNGQAPEINVAFAVFPPMLASLCRQLRDKEIAGEMTRRSAVLQIRDRTAEFHEQPVEVRRKAVQDGLARALVLQKPGQDPDSIAERQAGLARYIADHDRYFRRPESNEDTRKRLKI